MPNGTINLGNVTENEPTDPPDSEDCAFDENNYYYEEFDVNNNITFKSVNYNGIEVFLPSATKGTLQEETSNSRKYSVCYTMPEVGEWVTIAPIQIWEENNCANPMIDNNEIQNIVLDYMYEAPFDPDNLPLGTAYNYSGSGDLTSYCDTKRVEYLEIEQNTLTLDVETVNQYVQDVAVPRYYNGDIQTVYCNYQRDNDYYGNMTKWVVNAGNASYWVFANEYVLETGATILDDSKAGTGSGYYARGRLMETHLGNPHYAVCTWGGW